MTLITSRQPKTYRWQKGDLISATEACQILGYKTGRNLQDSNRRKALLAEFAQFNCSLTLDVHIGGSQRFLRSEFEAFIDAKIAAVQKTNEKRRRDLRQAA